MKSDRSNAPISRIVGLYQMVLRRTLEHFFPDAQLEVSGDRSIIDWDGSADETYYRLHEDPDGLGVEIEWLGSHLVFQPGNPSPLLATERHLVAVIVEAIDLRFRGLFNQELSHRFDRFQYQTEDLIVADYLELGWLTPDSRRARGTSGRRAVDLREPQSFDRGPVCSAPSTIRPPRVTRTWRAHPPSTLA